MNTKWMVTYIKGIEDAKRFYCYASSKAEAIRLCVYGVRGEINVISAIDLREIPIKLLKNDNKAAPCSF